VDFTPSPALYPFDSRWLESFAGRVHYVDEGRGQPILMCHGNPTWSFLYRNAIRALRERFRCIAVDYLGFGLSERPPAYGYTPAEHAAVLRELVRELDLSS
jgi:haloalkane dehalogenase